MADRKSLIVVLESPVLGILFFRYSAADSLTHEV
jgi:hypothetical protein